MSPQMVESRKTTQSIVTSSFCLAVNEHRKGAGTRTNQIAGTLYPIMGDDEVGVSSVLQSAEATVCLLTGPKKNDGPRGPCNHLFVCTLQISPGSGRDGNTHNFDFVEPSPVWSHLIHYLGRKPSSCVLEKQLGHDLSVLSKCSICNAYITT